MKCFLSKSELLVYGALILSQLVFGGAAPIYKLGLVDGNPFTLLLYRQLSGGPILLVLAYIVERKYPLRKDFFSFLLVGFVGVFLNQSFFLFGVFFAGAMITAIAQLLIPPITSAIAIALRLEAFSFVKILGLVLSITGAAILIGIDEISFDGLDGKVIGILLLLPQTVWSSLQVILMKKLLMDKYPPMTVAAGINTCAIPFMLVLFFIFVPYGPRWLLSGMALWTLAYAIVFVAAIGYSLYAYSIKNTDPTIVAASTTLNPIVASILAVILLHETFGVRQGIGAAVIVAGFALIVFQKYRENKANAPAPEVVAKLLPTEETEDTGDIEDNSVIELEEMATDDAPSPSDEATTAASTPHRISQELSADKASQEEDQESSAQV